MSTFSAEPVVLIRVCDHDLRFDTRNPQMAAWVAKVAASDYEPGTTHQLHEDLQRARTFVDVGAYVGYFTMLAAMTMPDGVVHAFEMGRRNFRKLRRNLELNRVTNVVANRVAVTESTGWSSYVKGPDSFGAGHQLGISRRRLWNIVLNRVRTITLDDYFDGREPPDVVKIDVQGAELGVLKGMQRILDVPDLKLYVEVHPGAMRSGFGTDPQEILRMLFSKGYKVSAIAGFRASRPSLEPLDDRSHLTQETMLYCRK